MQVVELQKAKNKEESEKLDCDQILLILRRRG